MEKHSKIYVAGHTGMVGSALLRLLQKESYTNIVTRTSKELDLTNQNEVNAFFKTETPEYVFLAAAKVGGIHANNSFGGDFIHDNLMIQTNVIHAAKQFDVKKLVALGSSCIYPKESPNPIKEEYLMSGPLEPTNKPYAIAKIAGIEMCDAYRKQFGCNFVSAMPTNLSGPNDRYDLENGHVFPALIRKFYEAKIKKLPSVTLWGSGIARREFLHVDDLARGLMVVMEKYNEPGPINIGYGSDVSISELAEMIREIVGYEGIIMYDTSMPDGTLKKLIDSSKIRALDWKPEISLVDNIKMCVEDFIKNFIKYT
ncbi:nucleotide-sugar epimerase [Only Syngen Nebraska virus 5]|uniref:nucleotide-sugar epimerase n=1 Tax=Only Syngen Nebraska virus 5 TaxID=1917232 RepID=UPI000901A7B2|nr:nucleotide-sugar epimerase [Only Syngen Nebraska virus 5]APC25652.1 GDP-L-fucose synthase 2 [Only Syngen Nebraska virus 5]